MITAVSFELAKLLIQKSYDLHPDFKDSYPTIAEVVMWLYEKHGIWIWITPQIDMKGEFYWKWYANKLNRMSPKSATSMIQHPMFRDMNPTPEKSYEAGIEYVLKNLI
jgi:hypothetical protein